MTTQTAAAAVAAEEAAGEDSRLRVRRIDLAKELARLETYVGRMERRYEYGSDEMLGRLQSGVQKCTAEISQWMFRYRGLVRWLEGYDPATGERMDGTWEPPAPPASRDA